MIRNYLKLAIRLFLKNPLYSVINTVGLAIGFAVFLMLWPFSQSELDSDTMWKDYKDIYRYNTNYYYTDNNQDWNFIKFGTDHPENARRNANDFSQFYDHTRLLLQGQIQNGNWTPFEGTEIVVSITEGQSKKQFKETHFSYADPNVFDFFGIPLVEGRHDKILDQANSIAISQKIATKYFGTGEALGKILLVNDTIPFVITGVFQDLPNNSHLNFELAASMVGIQNLISTITHTTGAQCYFKVKPGTDIDALKNDLDKAILHNFADAWKTTSRADAVLQPLTEVAFEAMSFNGFVIKSKSHLILLSIIGIVILIMAWINYSSLTLSSHEERLKEIATRKTSGAATKDLFKQFLTEAAFINVLAIFIAFIVVELTKTLTAYLLDFSVLPWSKFPITFYLFMVSIIACGIIFSALYPTLISVRYNPKLLYKKSKLINENPIVHHWLPMMQFASCIVMIILVLTSFSQTDFVLKKGFGLNQSNIVVVDFPILHKEENEKQLPYFINEISTLSNVKNITVSSAVPSDEDFSGVNVKRNNKNSIAVGVDSNGGVDENFIPFYGIKLICGRNFTRNTTADTSSIILSSLTAKRLGFTSPEQALGTQVLIGSMQKPGQVIGVYEDYEFNPLLATSAHAQRGSLLTYKNNLMPWHTPAKFSISISENNFEESISAIELAYKKSFHDGLFNWYFLDQQVKHRYEAQLSARNQIIVFTGISIFIGCMGLLGTISFKILRKTKEIGIRKVLGAEIHQIALLILKPTLRQVVLAATIGMPLSYYATHQYLQQFSERIALQWWHFAVPVFALILIMLSTIASSLWRAANNNPIEALKYE